MQESFYIYIGIDRNNNEIIDKKETNYHHDIYYLEENRYPYQYDFIGSSVRSI